MHLRHIFSILAIASLMLIISCASVARRMPAKLANMHDFLTQDDPRDCQRYHYNFERQVPRLYHENQQDSIFEVIEYIKSECGPTPTVEITRLLLLAEQSRFGDSLIGRSTISNMLLHRSEQEYLLNRWRWVYLYGWTQPVDNTHEDFLEFRSNLAQRVSSRSDISSTGRILGLYYAGQYDSAFSLIQTDEHGNSAIRESYDDFVANIKSQYRTRTNVSFSIGSWIPGRELDLLGNHPDIGFQLGGENQTFRYDFGINYRFSPTRDKYFVDSMGQIVATDKFNCWLFGADAGLKFIDNQTASTDIFVGVGYEVIYSLTEKESPEEIVTLGGLGASIGLRQRIFIDRRTGFYLGGIVRYSYVDYSNPRGTELSGQSLTVSLVAGWSLHETLNQFLKELNYKGNWRK